MSGTRRSSKVTQLLQLTVASLPRKQESWITFCLKLHFFAVCIILNSEKCVDCTCELSVLWNSAGTSNDPATKVTNPVIMAFLLSSCGFQLLEQGRQQSLNINVIRRCVQYGLYTAVLINLDLNCELGKGQTLSSP